MALRVDLGSAGVPDCEAFIEGETQEEVMDGVKQHLSSEHESLPVTDDLLTAIKGAIGPVTKN